MDHYDRPPACATNPDPIPTAQSPFFVVMSSTCSGANPVIMERCMDPDTGAIWEREIADLPTTHTERPEEEDSGPIGTFNERPERFELYRSGDVPPEEVFAIAGTMAAAPVLLSAAESLVKKLRGMALHPSHYAELEAAISMATTPYIPTPDINRA